MRLPTGCRETQYPQGSVGVRGTGGMTGRGDRRKRKRGRCGHTPPLLTYQHYTRTASPHIPAFLCLCLVTNVCIYVAMCTAGVPSVVLWGAGDAEARSCSKGRLWVGHVLRCVRGSRPPHTLLIHTQHVDSHAESTHLFHLPPHCKCVRQSECECVLYQMSDTLYIGG